MATEVSIDARAFHGQGSALRVVEEIAGLATTKTLEQARNEADAVSESEYVAWLSGHRKVGDVFKFKTRRGEAYILSW